MLSLQDMSDRLEIQDLLARYCEVIDAQDFDVLDDIFTPDAIVDYTSAGGARGNLTETKAYLKRALEQFTGMQHMLGLPVMCPPILRRLTLSLYASSLHRLSAQDPFHQRLALPKARQIA